jgi:hypothetical protein
MANEHRGLEDLYTAPPRGYTDEQVRRIQEAPYGDAAPWPSCGRPSPGGSLIQC